MSFPSFPEVDCTEFSKSKFIDVLLNHGSIEIIHSTLFGICKMFRLDKQMNWVYMTHAFLYDIIILRWIFWYSLPNRRQKIQEKLGRRHLRFVIYILRSNIIREYIQEQFRLHRFYFELYSFAEMQALFNLYPRTETSYFSFPTYIWVDTFYHVSWVSEIIKVWSEPGL